MVYKCFDKKFFGNDIENENISSKKLAEELQKPIIRKFNKIKLYSRFIDNIWGADLADVQLISKIDKGFRFLLCLIDVHSKYAWVIPLNDKKGITITNAFQKFLDKSKRKPNKIWVDQGSEIYNRSMKSWLEKIFYMEMYSTHNEGRCVAGRFSRILENKIYKYMTSVSKNVYIDKADVNKYNNTYHNTIKMKLADVNSNYIFDSSNEIDEKDPQFKVGDIVRISKYKNTLVKGCTPNWSKEVFVIKKAKHTVPLTYLKGGKLLELSIKKNCKKQIKKNLELKK